MKRSQTIIIALCHPTRIVAPATAAEWETTSRSTARSFVAYVTKEAVATAETAMEAETVAPENPVKMGPIQIAGVMMTTSGPALTINTRNTSLPTARKHVVYAEVVAAAEAILLTASGVHGLGEHAL